MHTRPCEDAQPCFRQPDTVGKRLYESGSLSLSLSAALLSPRGWGTSLPPAGIIDRVRSNWKTVMASLSLPGFPSSLSASSSRDASPPPSASGYDAGTRPTGFLAKSEF